jgi:hypothetical protein
MVSAYRPRYDSSLRVSDVTGQNDAGFCDVNMGYPRGSVISKSPLSILTTDVVDQASPGPSYVNSSSSDFEYVTCLRLIYDYRRIASSPTYWNTYLSSMEEIMRSSQHMGPSTAS